MFHQGWPAISTVLIAYGAGVLVYGALCLRRRDEMGVIALRVTLFSFVFVSFFGLVSIVALVFPFVRIMCC